MNCSESKKDILLKLKTLTDRGISGEKENAEMLLTKLMKKYGISEEELEENATKDVEIILRNEIELKICSQILYAYFDSPGLYKKRNSKIKYFTKLTLAQEIEFKFLLDSYLRNFYKELDIFLIAYVNKNNIFPQVSKEVGNKVLSSDEIEQQIRAQYMAQGIERARIRKCIGEGN